MAHNIYRFLTDDGLVADGTNLEMNVGSADKFYAGPADGTYWVLHRALIYMEDAQTMTASTYGGVTELTNGTKFYTTTGGPDGTTVTDFTGGENVHNNGEWGALCYDVQFTAPGNGNDILLCRYTFSKAGKPIILDGNNSDKIVVHIQDSLTGLLSHRVMIQGYETDTLTGAE